MSDWEYHLEEEFDDSLPCRANLRGQESRRLKSGEIRKSGLFGWKISHR